MPRINLSNWLSFGGAVLLSFLAGALVIFFGLPSSDFLERAFIGATALSQPTVRLPAPGNPPLSKPSAIIGRITDDPSKTFDGFTLYACLDNDGEGTEALLMDMSGETVHRWSVPKWQIGLYLPSPTEKAHAVHNFKPGFFGLFLDAQGDLLVLSHGAMPVGGCGLLRLDRDSNILWKYSHPIHHDVDVADNGMIYAIQTELLFDTPLEVGRIATPCHSDALLVLSPSGEPVVEPISILNAICQSPYAVLLSSLAMKRDSDTDLLHTNHVEVLRPERAAMFPRFRAGQALISMRNLDMIAVIDVESRSMVWAATGPWRAQHAPHFLENGHFLLFDNCGGSQGSRVLEYDPQTQAFPWVYPGPGGQRFYSRERGMAQRLPNGNILVVDSEGGKIMEVSEDHEVVWSFSTGRFISTARRYRADELEFLGGRRTRPERTHEKRL